MVMKRFLLFLLVAFSVQCAVAQKEVKVNNPLQDYQYKKEYSLGFRLQSNGFSVYTQYGWIKDLKRTRHIQLEYNYFINYAQKRQKPVISSNGREFLYGFNGHFHAVRASFGLQRAIFDKANRNGVRLSFTGFMGFSLGLLKPYYLNLLQPTNDGQIVIKPERYSEANRDRFLALDSIAGAAPTRYGLNQMQVIPGIHGKVSLDFDWGTRDAFVKALELGIMLDLYYKNVPIMVNKSNRFYQLGLFLAFHLGKRW